MRNVPVRCVSCFEGFCRHAVPKRYQCRSIGGWLILAHLSRHVREDLAAVADALNCRPRKTLQSSQVDLREPIRSDTCAASRDHGGTPVRRNLPRVPTCIRCNEEISEGARFCSACGASLVDPGQTGEERRIVSVLFVDLVGFASRSERLDPEDVRDFLTPYFARVRGEIVRFGGSVEKFIGDAVMAVFGAPTAYGDDAERAGRAALAIRDWAGEGGGQPRL